MDIRKVLLIGALPLALNGCVAAALVAGVTAGAAGGGAVLSDNRSVTTQVSDRRITDTAENRLRNSPIDQNGEIHIATYDGIVLMVGQVPSDELRQQAEQIVKGVNGARKVFNEVTVAGTDSILQATSDTWLTSKIKTEMLAKKGLNSGSIKVVTEDGVVYLMGEVTRGQAQLAADTARRVGGVRKVVEVFEYLS